MGEVKLVPGLEGRGEAPARWGSWCGVVGATKTWVRLRTGRALGVICWPSHPSSLLQVAIKMIPRNRVLGWSSVVSIFGALPDLAAPWLTMGSLIHSPPCLSTVCVHPRAL